MYVESVSPTTVTVGWVSPIDRGPEMTIGAISGTAETTQTQVLTLDNVLVGYQVRHAATGATMPVWPVAPTDNATAIVWANALAHDDETGEFTLTDIDELMSVPTAPVEGYRGNPSGEFDKYDRGVTGSFTFGDGAAGTANAALTANTRYRFEVRPVYVRATITLTKVGSAATTRAIDVTRVTPGKESRIEATPNATVDLGTITATRVAQVVADPGATPPVAAVAESVTLTFTTPTAAPATAITGYEIRIKVGDAAWGAWTTATTTTATTNTVITFDAATITTWRAAADVTVGFEVRAINLAGAGDSETATILIPILATAAS
jgi:hypothetical protein